jgi:hypothetical protein
MHGYGISLLRFQIRRAQADRESGQVGLVNS